MRNGLINGVLNNIPYDDLKYYDDQKVVFKQDIEHLMYRELDKALSTWDENKKQIIDTLEARGYKIL